MKQTISILMAIIILLMCINVTVSARMCDVCFGEGRTVCIICHGRGYINTLTPGIGGGLTVNDTCTACYGGYNSCLVCRGSGELPDNDTTKNTGNNNTGGTNGNITVTPGSISKPSDFTARIEDDVLLYYKGTSPIVEIPDFITGIGTWAFYSRSLNGNASGDGWLNGPTTFVTDVKIPSSVKTIYSGAFDHCIVLENIVMEPGVISIQPAAFKNCESLNNVVIPSSVTRIATNAFSDCKSLRKITIPPSVTTFQMGTYMFSDNMHDESTYRDYYDDPNCDIFSGCPKSLTIYGAANSAAEKYARDKGINFEVVSFTDGDDSITDGDDSTTDKNNNATDKGGNATDEDGGTGVSASTDTANTTEQPTTPSKPPAESKNSVTIEIVLDNSTARVNGTNVELDQSATALNGRTLVPVRFIAESLGATVDWDGLTQVVTISDADTVIMIKIDSLIAKVNGTDVILDQSAVALNGRTLVPVRFIAESLGATVDWDDWTKKITITTGNSTSDVNEYYADFPSVPDFGVFSGIPLYTEMGDAKNFWYCDCNLTLLSEYAALLESKGFASAYVDNDLSGMTKKRYVKDDVCIDVAFIFNTKYLYVKIV